MWCMWCTDVAARCLSFVQLLCLCRMGKRFSRTTTTDQSLVQGDIRLSARKAVISAGETVPAIWLLRAWEWIRELRFIKESCLMIPYRLKNNFIPPSHRLPLLFVSHSGLACLTMYLPVLTDNHLIHLFWRMKGFLQHLRLERKGKYLTWETQTRKMVSW